MVMTVTTIPISKEFHDWLKGKGKKGESYEDVIKRLLKPELIEELGDSSELSKASNESSDKEVDDILDN